MHTMLAHRFVNQGSNNTFVRLVLSFSLSFKIRTRITSSRKCIFNDYQNRSVVVAIYQLDALLPQHNFITLGYKSENEMLFGIGVKFNLMNL